MATLASALPAATCAYCRGSPFGYQGRGAPYRDGGMSSPAAAALGPQRAPPRDHSPARHSPQRRSRSPSRSQSPNHGNDAKRPRYSDSRSRSPSQYGTGPSGSYSDQDHSRSTSAHPTGDGAAADGPHYVPAAVVSARGAASAADAQELDRLRHVEAETAARLRKAEGESSPLSGTPLTLHAVGSRRLAIAGIMHPPPPPLH